MKSIFATLFLSILAISSNGQKPNVLFISIDDLNDWVGALGGHPQAITPHMDRLFESGSLFTNAHCSQAVCAASRNSLLSGLHPTTTGWYGSTSAMRRSFEQVMGNHRMLPQYFKDHGYKTLAVGKIFHSGVSDYKDRTPDFWNETAPDYKVPKDLKDRGEGYGGTKFYPFPREGSQIVDRYGEEFANGHSLCWDALEREDMPGGKMFDELIAEWAVDQLEQEHDEPFFLAVGFVRPHVPYTAPKEYFDLYDLKDIAVTNLSDSYWRELVYAYLACVSFVDDQLGKVLTALENSPYADNTIIALWSDHGQHLGEKKHWRKQALWEESTQVPLSFKVPGSSESGQRSDRVVSLLDVYPTLIDLCGLPSASALEGQSLVPLIQNPDTKRTKPALSAWYYGNHAVRSDRWRYIRYRDGTEELYDHSTDPDENTNLAGNPEFASIVANHKKWLPEEAALPAGEDEWKPDKLDKRIERWIENDSIPEWLK